MLKAKNSLELLSSIQKENLYIKLVEQLNKDFQLAHLNTTFSINQNPSELKRNLEEVLVGLIQNAYDDYLNLLYRIDVSEAELLRIKSVKLEEIVQQITFLILKREFQKVWFKSKL